MKEKKKNDLSVLLEYAGRYKGLTFLGLALSAIAMILGMLPYICIWLVVRDLISVAPDWTKAVGIAKYGWMAFAFALLFGSRKIAKRNSEITKEAAIKVSDGIQETLENIREIRATNQEDRFISELILFSDESGKYRAFC